MKRQMTRMSCKGDEMLKEWDTETVSASELKEIEREFNARMKEGYFAADITPGKESAIIQKFDPSADILLMPRMQGGCGL